MRTLATPPKRPNGPALTLLAVLLAGLLVACGDSGASTGDGGASADGAGPRVDGSGALVTARPYESLVPAELAPGERLPLVLMLHGYSFSGNLQAAYLGLKAAVEPERFLLAYPDGTFDGLGNRFWAATDACCGTGGPVVDDVAYLGAVIDDMSTRYPVDPARIYVVGHSNGGFMAHRLACELAPRIAAIVSLAGATWNNPTQCSPSEPVNVLQIHGDADALVLYAGGTFSGVAYPGAVQTVDTWADKSGCGGALASSGADFELDANVIGAETSPSSHTPCPTGGAADLWRMRGSNHIPGVTPYFAGAVIPWLYAHPKP